MCTQQRPETIAGLSIQSTRDVY